MGIPSFVEALVDAQPKSLHPLLQRSWESICEVEDLVAYLSGEPNMCRHISNAIARSDYVADKLGQNPEWVLEWKELLIAPKVDGISFWQSSIDELLANVSTIDELMVCLRKLRQQMMTFLYIRDLSGISELEETMTFVSSMADCFIQISLQWLQGELSSKYGIPRGPDGTPQELVVIAMGKHGAKELNVSSDIDLIFAYPSSGQTDHPTKPIDNQEYFLRLGRKLIQALDQVTADGFVFRVDMRLRPYGASGALVLNFNALEDYYQNQGRPWERFAMVKARAVTGSDKVIDELHEIVNPFVYRKYTDFSLVQSLREMKQMILSEVHRKGGDRNIKLGRGGIREVEFVVQACQLIHGGRDPMLQRQELMGALGQLAEGGYLPKEWVVSLESAYRFLRQLEHGIQALRDEQTQMIPDKIEDRDRVAWTMGFVCWRDLEVKLNDYRDRVEEIFNGYLGDEPEGQEPSKQKSASKWKSLWHSDAAEMEWMPILEEVGFDNPADTLKELQDLKESRIFSVISSEAQERFDYFLPQLLDSVLEQEHPSLTLSRVLGLVRAILGRSVYLVLLYENPKALKHLCKLCNDSPWIAQYLAKTPVILDELLDIESLYRLPPKSELEDELRQKLLRIPEEDLEAQMDCLRAFKHAHTLKVAVAELSGKLPLMNVSDYLTWTAEVILEQAMFIAWHGLVAKHGLPEGVSGEHGNLGFAMVGYGKLGGIELAYHSDLDMVFIHDAQESHVTGGEKPINSVLFYTRLGQRIIHILSAQTTQGTLYEVDMRLRPSGNSGLLVSSLRAFEKYQTKEAWTWEHQALVRARYVCGDHEVGNAYLAIRRGVISIARNQSELKQEVSDMRYKMRHEAEKKFKSSERANNDIKQGAGGLIDIEFLAQYTVLAFASKYPELLKWTDNVRILELVAQSNLYPTLDINRLIEAYKNLRSALHKINLADSSYLVDLSSLPEEKKLVQSYWRAVFED